MHAWERCTPERDACLRYTSVKTPIKKIGTLIRKVSTLSNSGGAIVLLKGTNWQVGVAVRRC
jgi:hypothetical protein